MFHQPIADRIDKPSERSRPATSRHNDSTISRATASTRGPRRQSSRPMPLRTQPFPCRGSATVQRRGAPICKTACTAYSKETSLKRPVPKNARRQAWPLPSPPASTTGASCIDRPAPCPCTGCNLFEADIFRIEAQQRFTESRESPKPITEHSAVRAYREELLGHEPPLFPRLRRLRHPDEPAIEALNGQRPTRPIRLAGAIRAGNPSYVSGKRPSKASTASCHSAHSPSGNHRQNPGPQSWSWEISSSKPKHSEPSPTRPTAARSKNAGSSRRNSGSAHFSQ